MLGTLLEFFKTVVQFRADKLAVTPVLAVSPLRVSEPPPHSESGSVTFEISNTQGGKGVMTDLLLVVLEHGASEEPKMVEAAAPVPQFTYKVILDPEVAEYDVRQREFGSAQPHSYETEEVESFNVELRSKAPQWYRFQFVVRWYDSRKPQEPQELRSAEARIEFKPSVEDLLS